MSASIVRRLVFSTPQEIFPWKIDNRIRNVSTSDRKNITKKSSNVKVKLKLGKKTYLFIEPPVSCPSSAGTVPKKTIAQLEHGDAKVSNLKSEFDHKNNDLSKNLVFGTGKKTVHDKNAPKHQTSPAEPNDSSLYQKVINESPSINLEAVKLGEIVQSSSSNYTSSVNYAANKIFQSPSISVNNGILKFPYLGGKSTMPYRPTRSVLRIGSSKTDLGTPSVSHILNSTMSPTAAVNLARWRESMVAKLGEDGFLSYKNALLQRGKDFHNVIEKILLHESKTIDVEISAPVKACFQSIQNVLCDVKGAYALESHVVHPNLQYRGFMDCVAEYKGQPTLMEWKHSEKKKRNLLNTYDNPIQLMAYLGALNFDSNYPYQVEGCVLVIAYTDGSPAEVYHLTCDDQAKYWQMWLHRLKLFWEQQQALCQKEQVSDTQLVKIDKSSFQLEKPPLSSSSPAQSSEVELRTEVIPNYCLNHKDSSEKNVRCTDAAKIVNNSSSSTLKENPLELPSDINLKFLNNTKSESNIQRRAKSKEENGFFNKLWKMWKS